jgi:hypothetical protein
MPTYNMKACLEEREPILQELEAVAEHEEKIRALED